MWKAGLIGAAVGLVLGIAGTLIMPPLCNPCAVILLTIGFGVLGARWEGAPTQQDSVATGAKTGAIAAAGSLLGEIVGAVLNGLIIGPEGAARLARQFGLPAAMDPTVYWVTNLGGNCLCGLINIALGAGFGALGGLIWHQARGRQAEPAPPEQEQIE